jgi:hypothetical protein
MPTTPRHRLPHKPPANIPLTADTSLASFFAFYLGSRFGLDSGTEGFWGANRNPPIMGDVAFCTTGVSPMRL